MEQYGRFWLNVVSVVQVVFHIGGGEQNEDRAEGQLH